MTIDNIQRLANILDKVKESTKAIHDIVLDIAKDIEEYSEEMVKLMESLRDES